MDFLTEEIFTILLDEVLGGKGSNQRKQNLFSTFPPISKDEIRATDVKEMFRCANQNTERARKNKIYM